VLRNRVVKLIKRDKTAYQKKLFKQFRSNPKRFYGYFRRMQTVKTTVASIRTADGKLTTTDQETAETLCDYFGEVFTKEDTWKQDGITPVANSLEILITEELILKALTKLKVDKSPGPDNIHPMVLREAATEVVEPLTMIGLFRKSLSQGELPEDWRKANISPHRRRSCEGPGVRTLAKIWLRGSAMYWTLAKFLINVIFFSIEVVHCCRRNIAIGHNICRI